LGLTSDVDKKVAARARASIDLLYAVFAKNNRFLELDFVAFIIYKNRAK